MAHYGRGRGFSMNSFNSLLKNRKYIGEYCYQDVVIPGGVPAIVPEDIFNRVQEKMDKNKRAPARAKADDDFLLTIKLFCGKCGCMMIGDSGTSQTGAKHYYYKCGSAKRKTGCDKKAVKKQWIEDVVIQQTMKIVVDGPLMERITDRLLSLQGEENHDLRLLEQQLSEVEKGIENVLDAIQAGIITTSTKQRLAELEAEKEELEQQITTRAEQKPLL